MFFQRSEQVERATARYLGVVKSALLDEHYLENEARLAHLTSRIAARRPPEARILRDPVREDPETYRRLVSQRFGAAGPDEEGARSFLPFTAMGRTRLDHLERCLEAVRAESVPGDFAECGTGRGGGAIFMRAFVDAHEMDRRVWVADHFRAGAVGRQTPSLPPEGVAGFQADINLVRDGFERFHLLDDRVRFLQGPMAATLADAPIEQLALLRIGRGIGDEVGHVLDHLYDRVAVGGFIVVDDEGESVCRRAVASFRAARGLTAPLERIDWSAVAWRKTASEPSVPSSSFAPTVGAPRAPLAPPAPTDVIDLSIVVVFYNMRREAVRTLHALSRAYQEAIDDVSYEVIAVENGSDPDQKLDAAFVESFGPEFRYLDLGGEAQPSPVMALNRGIAVGRGKSFALMIDGAHVLTPGVLRFGLAGLATYAPAIVVTQQWYVGPGQQGHAMDTGYDQAYEDRLFETIDWPRAGYRLFEIGHFVGDRDWLDGVWESNCLFVNRSQLEQVGCFDESFSMAGGGYANLELYERLGSSADITVATILGEGSFHQLHGGTTTNEPDAVERRSRVYGYGQHYADLRGRMFRGPGKPLHYVGRFTSPAARRTKPRRLSATAFAEGAARGGVDGRPITPSPVPDELKWEFVDAVWRGLPWRSTTWLGRRVTTAPTDLLAYQEMIAAVRPDWVVETGTGDGGRSLFLASICELVGHGTVLSIDETLADDLPGHPRLRYQAGRPHAKSTVKAVHDVIGEGARAVVILGSCVDRPRTTAEFEAYAPLVPVGSYVVVADSIVNRVWAAYGSGPADAIKQILANHGDFVHDPTMEKYFLTFNPGGFLRRVK